MTEKQNYLEALTFGKPDHVPYVMTAAQVAGILPNDTIEFPEHGDYDAFGVHWLHGADGSMPDNSSFMMDTDSITEWRDIIKFPDLEQYPWEQWADIELADVDRGERAVYILSNNGIFDRYITFMGYTEGLISMLEEPEAAYDLMGAIADYKIDYINYICKYYKPDVFHYQDDLATASGLFMAPDLYREIIKPHHARVIAAIRDNGVIAEQHCCGRCEDIVDDFVEMGVQSWYPAQLSNDLDAIKKKYQGRLAFNHGLDSQGVFADPNPPEEVIRQEVRRAVDHYASGGGLVIMPCLLGGDLMEVLAGTERRYAIIQDELKKYGSSPYVANDKD